MLCVRRSSLLSLKPHDGVAVASVCSLRERRINRGVSESFFELVSYGRGLEAKGRGFNAGTRSEEQASVSRDGASFLQQIVRGESRNLG
jgi:hypothetical protein